MSFLKKLFKKKEGGTKVGNILRGAAKIAKPVLGMAANAVVPGAGLVVNALPLGQGLMMKPEVQNKVADVISKASAAPAQDRQGALQLAREAKAQIASFTGSVDFADKVGRAAYEAAAQPASPAATGTIKDEMLKILKAAAEGAKDGALDEYLNETESGKKVVRDATENQIEKYAPIAVVALLCVLAFKAFK